MSGSVNNGKGLCPRIPKLMGAVAFVRERICPATEFGSQKFRFPLGSELTLGNFSSDVPVANPIFDLRGEGGGVRKSLKVMTLKV